MENRNPSMQEILSSIRRIIAEDNDDFGTNSQQVTRAEESRESGGDDEGLLSVKAESEVSESLGRLLRENVATLRGDEVVLDSLVSNLVRPLLRQWLDTHLPEIIERLVREEIRRLMKRGGGG